MTEPRLAPAILEIGKETRRQLGTEDVRLLKQLKWTMAGMELGGRYLMCFVPGFWPWFAGVSLVGFHLSVESQLNHSIMHGAYLGLPGAGRFTPSRYETLAVPFQCQTWREAHRLHHVYPSLLGKDPDTVHPLFRVHEKIKWRPWHLLNTFIGAILVFECWAFDYDRFLKKAKLRPPTDRGELKKFLFFIAYQYLFFAVIAGAKFERVLVGTLISCILRNLVFAGLQTCSSVGNEVSTLHCEDATSKSGESWYRFQIETSKNFIIKSPLWQAVCGGLDKHIEHHLYPNLPPNRLYGISPKIRDICQRQHVKYSEYSSFIASLKDTISYLWKLSFSKR